jgi:hypothetical protein
MHEGLNDIVRAADDVARLAEVRLELVDLVQQVPVEDLEVTAWLIAVAYQMSRSRQSFLVLQ